MRPAAFHRSASRLPLRAATILALSLLASCQRAAASPAEPTGERPGGVRALVVQDPSAYWKREGFIEMAPTVRVSVGAGGNAETRIYLRMPEGAALGAFVVSGQGRRTLRFPPGTVSDRVSYVLSGDGRRRTVDDVRGTRWDSLGREYFHVYLPSGPDEGAPLVGYEWRRDDEAEEREATELLIAWSRAHPAPFDASLPSDADLDRFRRLNHCQSCHITNKPEARSVDEPLPPWPTDEQGLYVPLAVLVPLAPLSNDATFDDPNAGDAFVSLSCPVGGATLHSSPGLRWFSCKGGGVPRGERDVRRAMLADDDYARRTCEARRYLFSHMTSEARSLFADAMAACAAPP